MEDINQTKLIEKILQSGLIIAIFTCVSYLWGWHYMDSFFERFGIHHDSFSFPPVFYLNKSFFTVIFFAMILIFSMDSKKGSPLTIPKAFRENSIIFVFLAIGLFKAIKFPPSINAIMVLANSVILIVFFIVLSCKRKSIISIFKNAKPLLLFIGFFFIVNLGLLIGRELGNEHARRTIDGTLNGLSSISFETSNSSITKLNEKELIFIYYYDDSYYLIEKEKPAPEFPKVFIVSKEKINYAIFQKLN